ncbi:MULTISPECIES: hypothetical protein [Oscillatoriales]|uniref:hypothetical protein n=1 Tax=Planktothrix sp. FACHB-1355 TaxID=2692854 RepID=UPI001F54C834|nr:MULTISPECIES: hypothetical protein [Oscillatoriales]
MSQEYIWVDLGDRVLDDGAAVAALDFAICDFSPPNSSNLVVVFHCYSLPFVQAQPRLFADRTLPFPKPYRV